VKTLFIAIVSIALSVAVQFSLKAGMSGEGVRAALAQPYSLRTLFEHQADYESQLAALGADEFGSRAAQCAGAGDPSAQAVAQPRCRRLCQPGVGGLVQPLPAVGAEQQHPAGGVGSGVLSPTGRVGHGGLTQTNRFLEKPAQFKVTIPCVIGVVLICAGVSLVGRS
jgi:hypothetical protein